MGSSQLGGKSRSGAHMWTFIYCIYRVRHELVGLIMIRPKVGQSKFFFISRPTKEKSRTTFRVSHDLLSRPSFAQPSRDSAENASKMADMKKSKGEAKIHSAVFLKHMSETLALRKVIMLRWLTKAICRN